MSITPVFVGSAANDGTGDPPRTAFEKVNANEAHLATRIAELALNVRDFGAVGNGVTDDRLAIQAAIDAANAAGGGFVYVPPVNTEAGEYYRLNGMALYMRDNVHIIGAGPDSLIFNDKASNDVWMDQGVFQFGNFSPRAFHETVYRDLDAIAAGARVVTLSTTAEAANYEAGDLILIRSVEHWDNPAGWDMPIAAFITEAIAVNAGAGTVTLRHSVPVEVANALIGNPRERQTGAGIITDSPDPFGEDYFIVRRASIENLGIRSHGTWTGHAGMLECVWRRLWIDSNNAIYGNGFSHCLVEDVWARFRNKLVEPAMFSYRSQFVRIRGERGQASATPSTSWVKIGENIREIDIDVTVSSGDDVVDSVVRVSPAFDCRVHVVADAPGISGTPSQAVLYAVPTQSPNQGTIERVSVTGEFDMGLVERFVRLVDNSAAADGSTLVDNTVRVRATGTTTVAAATVQGVGTDVSGSDFGHGALEYVTGAVGTVAQDVRTPVGFSGMTEALRAANPLHRLITPARSTLAALSKTRTGVSVDVNSTTSGNVHDSIVIPAGTLRDGDEIHVLLHGRIVGTNDQKQVRLHIAETTTDVSTLSWAAGAVTSFHVDARVYFRTTALATGFALQTQGTTVTGRNTVIAHDASANDTTIQFQAWVANAADVVRVDRVTWRLVPRL